MRRHQLTTRRVAEIIKSKEYGRHLDGHGLMLVGSKAYGTFHWILRLYRGTVTGKPRDVGLGSAEFLTLKEARDKAHDMIKLAADGIDPIEQRRKALADARAEASSRVVFKAAAEEFLAVYGPTWKNDKHRKQWQSSLANYAYHRIGSVPVSEISAALINETIMPLFAKAPETGRRVRERILRVVKWVSDGRPPPTTGGNGSAKHHAALPYAQIPAFLEKLRARPGNGAVALELAILTAARTNEVLGAKWDEVNLDERVWVVPAARMKSGREHVVPLSDRAIEILTSMPRSDAHVFPGRFGGEPNSQLLLETLKKVDPNLTVHGFRSSFRDWAGDQTSFPKDVIEHALAHAVANKVEAAYRRGSAIEKRRKLMGSWAQWCESPQGGTLVTTLRRA
jgi:integrase